MRVACGFLVWCVVFGVVRRFLLVLLDFGCGILMRFWFGVGLGCWGELLETLLVLVDSGGVRG